MQSFVQQIARIPRQPLLGHLGWMRGALGGTIGIAISGTIGVLVLGTTSPALPWLVAPTGASAVLVFAVPASPLAQPWPVIGGSIISAAVGLLVGQLTGAPILAASIAIGLAIAAMSVTRCLHPPGGACAVLYALGAAGPEAWGWLHLLAITANVAALASAGWLYNNLTGHPWPHRPVRVPEVAKPATRAAAVHGALTEVLADWNEVIDADIDDLDAIFQAVERRIRSTEQDAPPSALI
ncbi:HPP family protein [Novosphingobium sp. M1R2S20]|uniref:HPP family protein n=1 Tax=Novosphingobium rhizovicinum TaxID=3228928 RepID=A0ABV3RHP7_9SPHN